MSFVYTYGANRVAYGDLHWDTDTFKICLCMSSTDADTEVDAANMSAFSLDEYDGSGYTSGAAGRIAVTTATPSVDTTNDRIELDLTDISGLSLSGGSRNIVGFILYADVGGADATNVPFAWIDSGGFPIVDTNLTGITFSGDGLIHFDL